MSDIAPLAQMKIDKTKEIAGRIRELLSTPKSLDELLTEIFNAYSLTMTLQQNVLVGSTVRSCLSYLKELGEISFFFENNRMFWQAN